MKKTYMAPAISVTALTEQPLCAGSTQTFGIDRTEDANREFNAKSGYGVFEDDEYEEDY